MQIPAFLTFIRSVLPNQFSEIQETAELALESLATALGPASPAPQSVLDLIFPVTEGCKRTQTQRLS